MSIMLASEPVHFDRDFNPQFTKTQIAGSDDATRAGLARWAKTPHGREILEYFAPPEYVIRVHEDTDEPAAGRAPQPGIGTFVFVHDHSRPKTYDIILNPAFFKLPDGMHPLLNMPATPADMMAIAWAGEMLHVYFYAHGIVLPHHSRGDFQDEWQAMADELHMPLVTHKD